MIEDRERAGTVLEGLMTLQEAAMELHGALASGGENRAIDGIARDMDDLLSAQAQMGQALAAQDADISLVANVQCAQASLSRIRGWIRSGQWARAHHKLEFELFPILQEAYQLFYFWGCVHPDPDRIAAYDRQERMALAANSYIDDAVDAGRYAYDLSIVVIAYNKLPYTRMCVESILRNLPSDIRCELILYNHGSSDGTEAFFESIGPHKQMDIAVNGGAGLAVVRIIQGEFALIVSNDVIVTKNAIANMVRCARENPRAAMIVPATPNISNRQGIPASYTTMQEMHEFAERNNRYDPARHERRVRLCNPIALYRSADNYSSRGYVTCGAYFARNLMALPDDQVSLFLRRRGYELILQKDAYCHHFGSVTLREEITRENQEAFYRDNRAAFQRAYGVDPWGYGFCYDRELLPLVRLSKDPSVTILGINCGLGSDALKVKEMYREAGRPVAKLVNATDEQEMLADLRGTSDDCLLVRDASEAFARAQRVHHILMPKPLRTMTDLEDALRLCRRHLAPDGQILMMVTDEVRRYLKRRYPSMRSSGNWVALT